MKGFIVYPTYTSSENETWIHLFGRLENGESFLATKKFEPYFYVREKDAKKLSGKAVTEKTELRNFSGERVVKVCFNSRAELNEFYKKIHKIIPVYESDIRPHYKFIIDNYLLGSINIEGDYESSEKIDRIYRNAEIASAEFNPELKILSLDIESGNDGKLYCIGLAGRNYRKNFIVTKEKLKNAVSCENEEDCLEKFKQEFLKLDPDIITGWNVIDFDFVFLRNLFRKHKVKFDIGRTDDEPKIRIEGNFFRASSMDIPGRIVLDALNLIRDPFIKDSPFIRNTNFESFTLEDVSQAVLGKGKLMKGKGRHEEIDELYKTHSEKSLQKLVDYNLLDCQLVLDILEKTKMTELSVERSQLTGMPLDKLSGSIAAFDSLYIRAAKKKGLVSPSNNYQKKEKRIEGGYVQSLKPGIYKNVLVLDFKSLYPSIIRTFNIDPASYLEKKEKGAIESPNGAYFRNEEGVLPGIIEKLHYAREKAKKEGRQLSSHAIKIIMNSFFGVLASENCRYFSLKMANAITHFGQFLIKMTAKEIEEKFKCKVIYSDTDSVFIETNLGKTKANNLGSEIEKYVNDFYDKYVKKNYSRKSFLELEFEKQYLCLMIPKVRGQETAAKKRYAGLKEKDGKEEIEIVGLEAIRGDWTEAAQEFQRSLLDKLFHEEPIEKFIKDYIKNVRSGKMNDKLVYRKSIRKSLDEYTKTTPPHVKAARQLPKLESNLIEYYMTTSGPEPIQRLRHEIDYEHYIKKQIEPIANQILVLLGKSFDDVEKGSKQKTLF